MEKLISLSEEATPLFNRLLEIMHREAMNSRGNERYGMFMNYYESIDKVRLESAGVIGYKYVNPAVDWEKRSVKNG
ncbi:MAG: hypothetical protein FWF51_09145 [Chitinivibrionia bacterium]|nr:hypothetical protein [Chitinivibrionia bacterium]